MAKIVDKNEKRKEIALSCKNLLLEKGIKVTISELAKTAGIGKGTVYEYFKNKEDMIFEILNILIDNYNKQLLLKLKDSINTEEKLIIFFEFFYDPSYSDLRKIYKEFIIITLTSSYKEMKNFATKNKKYYYEVLHDILKEGIEKKELKKKALKYKNIIYNMCEGAFLENEITNLIENPKNYFQKEIKLIYKTIRNKK